jgi:ribonuclease Z
MRPLFYPNLVNGRFGDPVVYVEMLFEKHAVLFDIGDISTLSPRKIFQVDHVLVSHTHIDHFFGFDFLLRVLVGRQKTINIAGPTGFIDQVQNKLLAYRWNLVDRYLCDLVFVVSEVDSSLAIRQAQFRFKNGFAKETASVPPKSKGVLYDEPLFRVSTAVLDHRTPCLAFALEETKHVNVWKTRLEQRGLPVGPWLHGLKRAVLEAKPGDYPIQINSAAEKSYMSQRPLAELRDVVTVSPGQKVAYVTDAADNANNRAAIVQLARGADILFIESAFAAADKEHATERAHLTTKAAGEIAREAGVRRVEPFHFSKRYHGSEQQLSREVEVAFSGGCLRGTKQ